MTKIYTRTGDFGQTSLVGGTRVLKTHPRLEAYGTIDELSSHLGLLDAMIDDAHDKEFVLDVQHALFSISAMLATEESMPYKPAPLEEEVLDTLEQEIDELQTILPPLRAFIIPGGSAASAQAHVCRTVCRRAERRVLAVAQEEPVDDIILKYINRLSDYLFVLGRKINSIAGVLEIMREWREE